MRDDPVAPSIATTGAPVRSAAPANLMAEGYIDVEGTYILSPYTNERKNLLVASTKLTLASDEQGKQFGVPEVRELTTYLFSAVNDEQETMARYEKIERCLERIEALDEEPLKSSLLALLYRRCNNLL